MRDAAHLFAFRPNESEQTHALSCWENYCVFFASFLFLRQKKHLELLPKRFETFVRLRVCVCAARRRRRRHIELKTFSYLPPPLRRGEIKE